METITVKSEFVECENNTELLACRVCLSTNTKLFNLFKYNLNETFSNFVGAPVLPLDKLPQYVCSMCRALLLKSEAFRTRCRKTHFFLQEMMAWKPHQLTTEHFQTLNRTGFKIPLNGTETLKLDYYPESDQYGIDQEIEDANDLEGSQDTPYDLNLVKIDIEEHFPYDMSCEQTVHVHTENVPSIKDDNLQKESKSKTQISNKTKKVKRKEAKRKIMKVKPKKIKRQWNVKLEDDYKEFSDTYEVDVIYLNKEQQLEELNATKETSTYEKSRFKCTMCYRGYMSGSVYKKHMMCHDPSTGDIECEICHLRYSSRLIWLRHIRRQHKVRFVCRRCGQRNKCSTSAKLHFKWHEGFKYTCRYCSKNFTLRKSCMNHEKEIHIEIMCDECGETFAGQLALTAHKRTHEQVYSTDGLPQYICYACKALLQKSAFFRNQCRNAHYLLQDARSKQYMLSTNDIHSIDRSNLKLPFCIKILPNTTYPDDELKNYDINVDVSLIKEEESIEIQDGHDPINNELFDTTDFDDQMNEKLDDDDDNDNIKTEDGAVFVVSNDEQTDKTVDVEKKNKVAEFVAKYIEGTKSNKSNFYEYILEKYVKRKHKRKAKLKVIEQSFDAILNDTDEELNSVKVEDRVTKINTEDDNKKTFYEYILQKYSKNTDVQARVDKVMDIARMREKKGTRNRSNKSDKDLAIFGKTYNVDIVYLTKEQHIAEIQARQETNKYKNSLFKCNECYRGFMLEKAFQNHMAIHDPSKGPYVCEVCRIRYPTRRGLMKHTKHTHNLKFICKLCNSSTRNSSQAKEHYRCHAGAKYECEHCGKIFRKYGSRVNHIRIYHGSHSCEVCHAPCVGAAGLLVHRAWAHREVFKCTSCAVQFHNQDALRRHVDTAPGAVCGAHVRPCTQCGENFLEENLLKEHVQEYHNQQRPRRFNRRTLTQSGDKKRPRRRKMEEGRREQKSSQKLMCDMCGAGGFASEAVLKYHQRIHTGEKPHACAECPKRFRIREQLRTHMRTHSGDRPYACAHCPKAFKTASAKYTHQVVHTKIRRHRCHLCEKSFLTSTCVKTHIRTVHMKIPLPPRVRTRPTPYLQQMHYDMPE